MKTESKLVKSQYRKYEKDIMIGDKEGKIKIEIRYDDECGNGHNSFAITGTIYSSRNSTADRYFEAGGCIHDEIIEHFPKFAHLIKWHLCNSDAPMHYVANTTYHARDREYKGKEIGEAVAWNEQLKFEGYPFTFKEPRSGFFKYLQSVESWESVEILEVLHQKEPKTYSANYTFSNYPDSNDWYKTPFGTKNEASEFLEALQTLKFEIVKIPTKWNQAVEPNLEAARSCAIWEDATLEQLQSEEALMERLPKLMQEFRKDIEALGFVY